MCFSTPNSVHRQIRHRCRYLTSWTILTKMGNLSVVYLYSIRYIFERCLNYSFNFPDVISLRYENVVKTDQEVFDYMTFDNVKQLILISYMQFFFRWTEIERNPLKEFFLQSEKTVRRFRKLGSAVFPASWYGYIDCNLYHFL